MFSCRACVNCTNRAVVGLEGSEDEAQFSHASCGSHLMSPQTTIEAEGPATRMIYCRSQHSSNWSRVYNTQSCWSRDSSASDAQSAKGFLKYVNMAVPF